MQQATTRSKLWGVLAERVHVKVWAYLFCWWILVGLKSTQQWMHNIGPMSWLPALPPLTKPTQSIRITQQSTCIHVKGFFVCGTWYSWKGYIFMILQGLDSKLKSFYSCLVLSQQYLYMQSSTLWYYSRWVEERRTLRYLQLLHSKVICRRAAERGRQA